MPKLNHPRTGKSFSDIPCLLPSHQPLSRRCCAPGLSFLTRQQRSTAQGSPRKPIMEPRHDRKAKRQTILAGLKIKTPFIDTYAFCAGQTATGMQGALPNLKHACNPQYCFLLTGAARLSPRSGLSGISGFGAESASWRFGRCLQTTGVANWWGCTAKTQSQKNPKHGVLSMRLRCMYSNQDGIVDEMLGSDSSRVKRNQSSVMAEKHNSYTTWILTCFVTRDTTHLGCPFLKHRARNILENRFPCMATFCLALNTSMGLSGSLVAGICVRAHRNHKPTFKVDHLSLSHLVSHFGF